MWHAEVHISIQLYAKVSKTYNIQLKKVKMHKIMQKVRTIMQQYAKVYKSVQNYAIKCIFFEFYKREQKCENVSKNMNKYFKVCNYMQHYV